MAVSLSMHAFGQKAAAARPAGPDGNISALRPVRECEWALNNPAFQRVMREAGWLGGMTAYASPLRTRHTTVA